MKNKLYIPVLFLLILSCSTKKNTFVNRKYHALTTKYNVLFNGKEAFKKDLAALNANYTDNFWERLPIEALAIEKQIPGTQNSTNNKPVKFKLAEAKAVKSIQKHAMLFEGKERNQQIDDAYLLLGKARYYGSRFVPALEAFNYVLLNYPNANLIAETKIWQAKTLIRLQNPEQAIENLRFLLKETTLKPVITEAAHTAMAMAYIKTDSLQQVISHLNKATTTHYNTTQTVRNLFVLGQLYSEQKLTDSANIAFQKILDTKKATHKYKIYAQLEKAKNASSPETVSNSITALQKLVKTRENRPFLDPLYYRLALLEKDTNTTINYLKKSLQFNKTPNFQKELSYETLGNLYFDKAHFLTAGAYYDSVLQIAKNTNSKRIRRLKKRENSLKDVILFENIAKTNDSILHLSFMSKEAQTTFFTAHIKRLKLQDEKQTAQKKMNTTGSGFKILSSPKTNSNGTWYFYNAQTVGFGKQNFQRIWGNRPLEDNWRLSDKVLASTQNSLATNQNSIVTASQKYDLGYYLAQIPTKKVSIQKLQIERNKAYLKLGIIYKERFKELPLATSKLEKLLRFTPNKNIAIIAKYHLYKIYLSTHKEKAFALKNDILSKYPASKEAQIIANPNQYLNSKTNSVSEIDYASVYYQYKAGDFENAIENTSFFINIYAGNKIIPKFELLKAYAIGKKDGIAAFKKALEKLVVSYPNTQESKKAAVLIKQIK